MNGRCLPDTNIFIRLFNDEQLIKIGIAAADEVCLSSIVLGELYYGAENSRQIRRNLSQIDELIASQPILLCDEITAQLFGNIKSALRQKGRPIPDNDIWIAAQALQSGSKVVTCDSHFNHVDGLAVENW